MPQLIECSCYTKIGARVQIPRTHAKNEQTWQTAYNVSTLGQRQGELAGFFVNLTKTGKRELQLRKRLYQVGL